MKQDDLLWKAVLEDVFDDFLLFFFKEEANIFDLEKGFQFLDKELDQLFPAENEELSHPRFVDKLVKVFTKEGRDEWFLVHVEIQGYNDPDFAKRMFTYFYRILDKYNKPVTCITIFTDNNNRYKPSEYHYNFLGVETIFRYNVYKLIHQDTDELKKSDNPFALVILTALIALQKGKLVEEEMVSLKIEIARLLFKKALPRKKIKGIMNFLKHYVHFENPENNIKFEQAITVKNEVNMGTEEYLLQKAKKEGLKEGLEKGAREKSVAFIKSLLGSTDFSDEKIAAVADVTVAFVEQVKESIKS